MMKLSKKITAILMIGLFSAFLAGCSQDGQSADAAKPDTGAVQASTPMHLHRPVKKERSKDKDIVGVWINHIDTDINQKITFHADHTWTENQHNVDNIYSGTWSIKGDHSIYLELRGND